MASLSFPNAALSFLLLTASSLVFSAAKYSFYQDFDIKWGGDRCKILDNGELLTLTLDNSSGSGFESRNHYLFGKIDMQLKLIPNDSAGTVTAYYLRSEGDHHDEIDFEFLGNLSGEPYTVHTNVYTQGKGEREQQFHLWFDPTSDFNTYSILWNMHTIVFSVNGVPIREFKNLGHLGVRFPIDQPMKLYSSLWDAEEWATRGGLIKTNWSQAPFTASYRNFNADACVVNSQSGSGDCNSSSLPTRNYSWLTKELDPLGKERLKWVLKNYMIYNYCTDSKRFPQGFPLECNATS